MPGSLWYIAGFVHLHPNLGLCWFHYALLAAYQYQYHWIGCHPYQEQDGKDRVMGYASGALSKSKSHYPAHKLEFLVLKWAVTQSFQEYLYGNTFAS